MAIVVVFIIHITASHQINRNKSDAKSVFVYISLLWNFCSVIYQFELLISSTIEHSVFNGCSSTKAILLCSLVESTKKL